ncbi:Hypothetical predicted protein [Paramuricea clavata]|uniref:Uncharacterized protein n=1 Tax=Paramuricea clavata TaxID=317549 RepID=A0A7D9EA68_PARCT|nr:Hypothetical predicted protein [Paramuricea clavata]
MAAADGNRDLLSAAVSGILASLASTSSSQTTSLSSSPNNVTNNEELGPNRSSPALSTTQALAHLFPQCGPRQSYRSETAQPYESESAFRSVASRPKRKRKIKQEKDYSFAKDIVLKDVFLLPSPEYKKVPRGKAREMLYAEGFVTSAVEIHGNWSENDAVKALEEQFKEKLMDIPPPR